MLFYNYNRMDASYPYRDRYNHDKMKGPMGDRGEWIYYDTQIFIDSKIIHQPVELHLNDGSYQINQGEIISNLNIKWPTDSNDERMQSQTLELISRFKYFISWYKENTENGKIVTSKLIVTAVPDHYFRLHQLQSRLGFIENTESELNNFLQKESILLNTPNRLTNFAGMYLK